MRAAMPKKTKRTARDTTSLLGAQSGATLDLRSLVPLLLISLVGIAIYANSVSAPFLFDDHHSILASQEWPGNQDGG